MKPLALYIHIPFCRSKCAYCDFASYPNREDCWARYMRALTDELTAYAPELYAHTVTSVFVGGGTPSLLPAEMIGRLLRDVRARVRVAADAEITLEANPGTVDADKLRRYRDAGVNRLSLGAQSFHDSELRMLGRIHTGKEIRAAVESARSAGFDNISLDLMYALPGQTLASWKETLQAAVALAPQHISAYSLIVEEGTPLAAHIARGEMCEPDEELALRMHRLAVTLLPQAGLRRYEISNYARPGFASRHNIAYWRRGEYLGLGCAAHSMMGETRFENPSDLDAYLSGQRRIQVHPITRREAEEEAVMLNTRMCEGILLPEIEREFGVDFEKKHSQTIRELCAGGFAQMMEGRFWLTSKGLEVQNAVVMALIGSD